MWTLGRLVSRAAGRGPVARAAAIRPFLQDLACPRSWPPLPPAPWHVVAAPGPSLAQHQRGLGSRTTASLASAGTQPEVQEMPMASPASTMDIAAPAADAHEHESTSQVVAATTAAGHQRLLAGTDPVIVYTDGSCLSNGQAGAAAGIGVYFGPDDPRNTAQRLPGPSQTNNRAELTAVLYVLRLLPRANLIIRTDSHYVANGVHTWMANWKRNGWRTATKRPVVNQDLWRELDTLRTGRSVVLEYVQAHVGHHGNEEADRLANLGAAMPRCHERCW